MRLPRWFLHAVDSGLDGMKRTEYTGDLPFWGSTPTGGIGVDKDSVLGLAAFWACVRYISSAIACLPWAPYRVTPEGGREEQRKHARWSMLKESPAPGTTSFLWREGMIQQALVGGNAIAEIKPAGMPMLDASRVSYRQIPNGSLVYDYADPLTKEARPLLSSEVFHLRGPSRDGVLGLSVVSAAAESIGLALAQQTYGASFFGAGTHVGGIYEAPGTPTKDQIDALRTSIDEDRGPRKAHRPRILTGGMTYKPDTIPPQDAQFLESRKFSAREIASLFGVPPHKIGLEEGATAYASREQAAIEAVVDCLMPWVVRLEQEANLKLLTPKERASGLYTHMNLDMQLRGDAKSRGEFYGAMVRASAMRPNEARAKEDMDADPDGNQLLVPRDLIPLSLAHEYAQSQVDANRSKGGPTRSTDQPPMAPDMPPDMPPASGAPAS